MKPCFKGSADAWFEVITFPRRTPYSFHFEAVSSCVKLRDMLRTDNCYAKLVDSSELTFSQGTRYPFQVDGFYGSPLSRRNFRSIPQDGYAMVLNRPARCFAHGSRRIRAQVAGCPPPRYRIIAVVTRKITCDTARQLPAAFASQLAQQASSFPANVPQAFSSAICNHVFNHDSPEL
jgi:hypothetical protein